MNIEVKNTVKPVDYAKSMRILEQRVQDVLLDKKDEVQRHVESVLGEESSAEAKRITDTIMRQATQANKKI